jgi:thiol-disulfide isomerase/thioredoxin
MKTILPLALIVSSAGYGAIVEDVRRAIAQKDFGKAESFVKEYREQHGATPEMLEALSWLGRGALAGKRLDKAEAYSRETQKLAEAQLKSRKLDEERRLPAALGAAIEVQAQVMAARGERSAAVDFLKRELAAYRATSIRTRLQKNLHLLSLEGKPAPKLEGVTLPAGKPVLLFFWAHWCPDCKGMAPVLARLKREFAAKGFVIVAPTQKYGYTRGGQDAAPAEETRYIAQIWKEQYAGVVELPAPISEENFKNYGSSTTPTLVLIDARGIVRMYHPGAMSIEELEPKVRALF